MPTSRCLLRCAPVAASTIGQVMLALMRPPTRPPRPCGSGSLSARRLQLVALRRLCDMLGHMEAAVLERSRAFARVARACGRRPRDAVFVRGGFARRGGRVGGREERGRVLADAAARVFVGCRALEGLATRGSTRCTQPGLPQRTEPLRPKRCVGLAAVRQRAPGVGDACSAALVPPGGRCFRSPIGLALRACGSGRRGWLRHPRCPPRHAPWGCALGAPIAFSGLAGRAMRLASFAGGPRRCQRRSAGSLANRRALRPPGAATSCSPAATRMRCSALPLGSPLGSASRLRVHACRVRVCVRVRVRALACAPRALCSPRGLSVASRRALGDALLSASHAESREKQGGRHPGDSCIRPPGNQG